MSSKKSNLVPLLALTAATATTCLAYFYLHKKKDDAKPPTTKKDAKESSPESQPDKETRKGESPLKAQTEMFLTESKQDDDAPNLANVSTCDDSGSDTSDAPSSIKEEAEPPMVEKLVKVTPKKEAAKKPEGNEEATPATKEGKESVDSSTIVIDKPKEHEKPAEGEPAAVSLVDNPVNEGVRASNETFDKAMAQEAAPVSNSKGDEKQSTAEPDTTPAAADSDNNSNNEAEPASLAKAESPTDDTSALPPTPEKKEQAVDEATPEKKTEKTEGDEKEMEVVESDLWEFLQKELQQGRKCAGCNTEEGDKKFKPCAKCRKVIYCGKACQKKHWKSHKKVCCK